MRSFKHLPYGGFLLYAISCLALFGGLANAAPAAPRTGITAVTKGPADVTVPPNVPPGEARRYGLGTPFQVGPRTAGIFCNLRVEGVAVGDFEDGTDAILFDDVSDIRADRAIPVTRNERVVDPETGERRIIVKYTVGCGFVPLGAKRADGGGLRIRTPGCEAGGRLRTSARRHGLFILCRAFVSHERRRLLRLEFRLQVVRGSQPVLVRWEDIASPQNRAKNGQTPLEGTRHGMDCHGPGPDDGYP